jgi:hypothetical protein
MKACSSDLAVVKPAPSLGDAEWRDANVETLHDWHPDFKRWACTFEPINEAIDQNLRVYWYFLTQNNPNTPLVELANHLRYEVAMWMARRVDRMIDEVTGTKETDAVPVSSDDLMDELHSELESIGLV